ncbi:hypothetical protein [Amylolactobacillus amylophilus]|uniref:hypothetical protein n=1 Tax=Amylolactobacillus amylophilus TaxID=1603 RepID=UPI000ABA23B0|nr:hypothetical protein [Amylolactobacillus amylophilus]
MGAIPYPDSLDKPARTMVTSEHTVSRMSHVIMDPGNGKLRLISPVEAEKINTFPKKTGPNLKVLQHLIDISQWAMRLL